ncbi:alanyl-tRNA editing protein [Oribacterium parvum]|uniref:alanyl-tRNA editing protein n=1 Tax=Oribacterium parvum TaxID=1501329 RepID=UPI0028E4403A|nr:alanyl-tRNA editing protein [Oribacterium parvum]
MFKNALYYQEEKESYKAKVLSCQPLCGKEKEAWEKRVGKSFPALFLLRLSEEPFYPEGGGQAPDKGTIDGAELLFAENVEDEYIVHLLAKEIPEGTEVLCKVDYAYRRRQSENHSGEHIFAGLISSRFGYSNVGFHMELTAENPHVTVDFNGELSEEALSELESAVNDVIRKNLPIEEKYVEERGSEEAESEKSSKQLTEEVQNGSFEREQKTVEFRQKKALSGAIRVVSIPGVDSCACCGTHVKRTGEIGLFKLLSFERHRGGTRVFLLSGELAFLDTQKKEKLLFKVSRKLSTDYQSLSERVEKLKEQTEEERGRRIALSLQAVELLGNSYKKEQFIQKRAVFTGKPLLGEALEYYGNKNLAVFHFPDFEMILLNKACESLKFYVDTDFFCFSRRGEQEWQFAGAGQAGFLERFKKWKEERHFSGGGKEEMLQGRFRGSREELKDWIDSAE